MNRSFSILDKALAFVMIVLVVAMVVSISAEIFLREVIQALILKAGGDSPGWLTGLSAPVNTASQTLLVWIGLLGAALAFGERKHLGVDVLVRLYPPGLRKWIDRVSTALVAGFAAVVMLWGGWLVCARSIKFDYRMPGFEELNRAWFYAVLPLSALFILCYALRHLAHPATLDATLDEPTPEKRVDE